MIRAVLPLFLVSAMSGWAADANPLSSEIRVSYETIKTNLLKMAERMPAENYGFKPMPEMENFGRRAAHIADANFRTCAGLNGEQKSLGAAQKTSKEDLLAALKQSFAYCDMVFGALNDQAATNMENGRIGSPPLPEGQTRSRLGTLFNVVRHSNEMYGYMSVYLRLKGVVPPSTEP